MIVFCGIKKLKQNNMKVMKFGGTSVGSPERMKNVSKLVTGSGDPLGDILNDYE